jgi:hypothetical protein
MLSTVGNKPYIGNTLRSFAQQLASKLPSGWRVLAEQKTEDGGHSVLKFKSPHGRMGSLLVYTRPRLEPKDVDLLPVTSSHRHKIPVLVAAPFISASTQQRLKARGFSYGDLTGNIHLTIPEPGLFIETTGAIRNPLSTPRERKSLKGAKAGRMIRALCDFRPPLGVRSLAKRAGIDAGYTSRLIEYLQREALITRQGRGPVIRVDWAGLLHRWSNEYSPFERGRVFWYLAPRGIPNVIDRLRHLSTRYAVSGSWAAAQFAPVAASRVLLCYTDEPSTIAPQLDVRPAEAGANIALATPFDSVVYERPSKKSGITVTAISQIAADLLTSPGRGPNEAEALIQWMREHENAWQT